MQQIFGGGLKRRLVRLGRLIRLGVRSPQNGLIALSILVFLGFLVVRIKARLLMGSVGVVGVGLLVRQLRLVARPVVLEANQEDVEADQFLGNLLLLGSLGLLVGLYSLGSDSEWMMALAGLTLFSGLGIYFWGLGFWNQQPVASLLILGGLTPKYTDLLKLLTQTLIPGSLEQLMAWGGYWGLRAIAQPAEVNGRLIHLPQGTIEVNWPCAGYEMATSICCASILMGLFFKQSWRKIALLLGMGVAIALICNVPRIVLLALANAYWGKASFDFWHESWGGQIFMSMMFTIYYYGAMAVIEYRPKRKQVAVVESLEPSPEALQRIRN